MVLRRASDRRLPGRRRGLGGDAARRPGRPGVGAGIGLPPPPAGGRGGAAPGLPPGPAHALDLMRRPGRSRSDRRQGEPDVLGAGSIGLMSLLFGAVVVLGKLLVNSHLAVASLLAFRFLLAG